MASVYQRTNKYGSKVWRVVVRIKGHPTVCEHHERKQVAYDRAAEIELQIKQGKFTPNKAKEKSRIFLDMKRRLNAIFIDP